MQRQNLTATLPATRVTPEMRERVKDVAEEAGCDMADVIRDALTGALVHLELQLGIKGFDDFTDEELLDAGIRRTTEERRVLDSIREGEQQLKEDRTVGLAWGPPKPEAPEKRAWEGEGAILR
jgi:hypothetical protein